MFPAFVLQASLALLILAAVPHDARGQAGAPQDDAEVLRQLERALADTLHTKSREEMERLLADSFVMRGSPDVDRDTWMREALGRCWGDRIDIHDFHARVDGSLAITWFALTFHVNPDTCEPGVLRSMVTDVWRREGDRWQLLVRHSSPAGAGVASQFAIVPEAPPRLVLLSELSFVSTAGNTSTSTIGAASDLTRQSPEATTRLRFSFVSTAANDVTQARATTLQARHGVRLRQDLEVFGRAAYGRDRFAGIDHRAAVEGGLAWTTGVRPRHQLTLEAGAGFTTEDRLTDPTLRFATATGTTRYVWQIAPGTELREELAVTSDLSHARNWRGTNSIAVSVALTRLLSLKVTNDLEYRNLPVSGFRRTDARTAAALVLTLRAR